MTTSIAKKETRVSPAKTQLVFQETPNENISSPDYIIETFRLSTDFTKPNMVSEQADEVADAVADFAGNLVDDIRSSGITVPFELSSNEDEAHVYLGAKLKTKRGFDNEAADKVKAFISASKVGSISINSTDNKRISVLYGRSPNRLTNLLILTLRERGE